MKKFLMTGIAALAIGAAFTSCSKEITQMSEAEIIQSKYETAFKKYVGVEIDENHTWGFGKVTTQTRTRSDDDANGNEFGVNYYVPSKLTTEQINVVMDWFGKNKNPNSTSISCDNFFAQYVGATDQGKEHMNYMTVGDDDYHISNLNAGDQGTKNVFGGELKGSPNEDWNNRKVYYDDKITHIINTNTTRFGYHNSNDDKMYYDSRTLI